METSGYTFAAGNIVKHIHFLCFVDIYCTISDDTKKNDPNSNTIVEG